METTTRAGRGTLEKMYPKGYPHHNDRKTCGAIQRHTQARCIIDNTHIGRKHWGPTPTGDYKEWT